MSKSKSLRIGVDVDGIVADFNTSYKELIESITNVKLPPITDTYPDKWGWEIEAGLSKADESRVWKEIITSPTFWYELPTHKGAKEFLANLNDFYYNHDIYFITSRPGAGAKSQTEMWLTSFRFQNPTVLISSQKGLCAKALKLTHYIDDRIENCLDVKAEAFNTNGYMLARPWNTTLDGIPRLNNLEEFLQILSEAAR